MERIWMGISPEATETRVIAMAGAGATLLKARLSRSPAHPRALSTLLEAIAPWEEDRGRPGCSGCGWQCERVRLLSLSRSVSRHGRPAVRARLGARLPQGP